MNGTVLPAEPALRPIPLARVAVAAVAGVFAAAAVALAIGLGTTAFLGTADNGDGARLYCGAGIVPATPDGTSNWKGAVVTAFTTGHPECPDPVPSSALPILRAAVDLDAGGVWSLSRLGWLYAALVGAAAAVAAWATSASRLVGALLVAPGVAGVAQPDFARFFVSTFSEPAGLLGAFTLNCGIAAVAATRPADRIARVVALALVAGGGLLAVTAKTAYVPLLLVAVVVCAFARVGDRRGWSRAVGPVVAVLAVLLAVAPVSTATAWQERQYGGINAHNVVFTLVLPELGPSATTPLGLPVAAMERSGEGFFVRNAEGIPGWDVTIGSRPDDTLAAAYRLLAANPDAAIRALGVSLQATRGADLTYLPSLPQGLPADVYPPMPRYPDDYPVGAQGADAAGFRAWLNGLTLPWLPALVVLLGLTAASLTAVRRHSPPLARGAALLAGTAAASALGLAAVAVFGDGYNELPKHVWLAAYMVDVAAWALIVAAAAQVLGLLRNRRTTPSEGLVDSLR